MQNPSTQFVNSIVRAGAGAGKTYSMIHKIVEMVRLYTAHNESELPRFVVTTFTRKATQEVRERLLAKALEIKSEDPEFGLVFLKFLKSSGSLLVSTIHGILNQFLRQHGETIGLDPDFRITPASPNQINKLLHQLLENNPEIMPTLVKKFGWRRLRIFFLNHHRASLLNPDLGPLKSSDLESYWIAQLSTLSQSIESLLPYLTPLLKKSKTMTLKNYVDALQDIHNLLEHETSPWKAIQNIEPLIQTMPKNLGSMSSWPEEAKILKKTLTLNLSELLDNPWTQFELVKSHDDDQNNLILIAQQFSQAWLKEKIAHAEINLDDLEFLSLYILRNFPDRGRTFSESWNYWFIDEYQDTSPIQVLLLDYLVGDRSHYVVGDPQQSIYFFRGARSKVFHNKFSDVMQKNGITEVRTLNRRSLSPVLNFINDLFQNVNSSRFLTMEAHPENHAMDLSSAHLYLVPENSIAHFNQLIHLLKNLLHQGTPAHEIAILCRENRELKEAFRHLQTARLPVRIASQSQFIEDREVKDAMALWTFLLNPFDTINLIELVRSPYFKISDELLLTAAQIHAGPLWNALLKIKHPVVTKLEKGLSQLSMIGHFETWQGLLMDSLIFDGCTAQDRSGRKEGNLWKLFKHLSDKIRQGTLDYLNPFELNLDAEVNELGDAHPFRDSSQIQLMTIHASKGLEFDHVIMPFLHHESKADAPEFWTSNLDNTTWSIPIMNLREQQSHSSFFAKQTCAEIDTLLNEESERLLYVAVTRAKKSLHFLIEDKDPSELTGWAKHFLPFLKCGIGKFKNRTGLYEYWVSRRESPSTLADESDKYSQHDTKSCLKESPSLTPIHGTLASQLETKSITSLLTQPDSQLSLNSNKSMESRTTQVNSISDGIRIHRILESYSAHRGATDLPEFLQKFILTSEIPFSEILEQCWVEWSFKIRTESCILEGQIDLFGKDKLGHLWIIDYKTGSEAYSEKAFEQLSHYAKALMHLRFVNDTTPVFLTVCFTRTARSLIRKVYLHDLLIRGSEK